MEASDLIVLTADADAEVTVHTLLGRHTALGIRPIGFRCARMIGGGHDPGCRRRAHHFLRPFSRLYTHALVVFDRHGCGDERDRVEIEADVEAELCANGWQDRSAAVVIDPELETWVWSLSPTVDAILGWQGRLPPLRTWLAARGFLAADAAKPSDPKRAMREALREATRSASPSLFGAIAAKITLDGCVDPAFLKFRNTLCSWFPVER